MRYQHAILGGTFDHFHIGHQAMIKKAFEIADRVTIGITTSEMYQEKTLAESIQDFDYRRQVVEKFITDNHWSDRTSLLPIKDKYGSTLTDPTVEAIVVSPETEKIAQEIVPEREAKGLSKIDIITVPFVLAEDDKPVSSQRIRKGEISSQGISYLKFFNSKESYTLPDSLREDLQQPIGDIHQDVKTITPVIKNKLLITVGDIVSTTLLDAGIKPHLAIVDFRTRRHDLKHDITNRHFSHIDMTFTNSHGTINPDVGSLFENIDQNSYSIIRIDGEEDLITLPAILLAPLGTIIIYGQYEVGMIVVEVSNEKKELIKRLLSRFN